MDRRNLRRDIRQTACNSCGGKRVLTKEEVVGCVECKGKGWVHMPSGTEMLCPTCKGFLTSRLRTECTCSACQGKGYFIQLIEIQEVQKVRRISCEHCGGTGRSRNRVRSEPYDCPTCNGTGHDFDAARKGIPFSTSTCPRCHGKLHVTKPVRVECDACDGTGAHQELYWATEERVIG